MKKFHVGLFALALAMATSAFTTVKTEKKSHRSLGSDWFEYLGSNPNQADSYNYISEPLDCDASSSLCQIQGDRQASPNQNLPTSGTVSAANTASGGFTHPADDGSVTFKP